MTQARTSIWFNTILLAVLGAAAQFGLVWALSLVLPSRTFPVTGVVGIGVLVIGAVMIFGLWRRYQSRSCLISFLWVLSYFIINIIGMVAFKASGMPAWLYLLLWLAFGGLGALLLSKPVAAIPILGGAAAALGGATFGAAQSRTPIQSSGFGRVPPSTVILLSQHVRTANQAAASLPNGTPRAIQDHAIAEVLRVALRDWWYNENVEGLGAEDQQDLAMFVQLAWSVCRTAPSQEEAIAVFKAVLPPLLDDWCAAWNGDDGPGAPRWQSR